MTGHKKIVGLWRDSATSSDATETPAAEAATAEPMGADEAGESRAEPSTEREWLDMSALAESDEADEAPADTPWRDRTGPTLLGLLATGWTLFAALAATDGFAHNPALADWPALTAPIPMPLPLLAVLWMAWLRSGRSGQARFADRKSVVEGKSVSVGVELGGGG